MLYFFLLLLKVKFCTLDRSRLYLVFRRTLSSLKNFFHSNVDPSEYKQKFDLVDREDEDSVEYSMRSKWIWNPGKSSPLTGEEIMVYPHLMILGMAMATLKDKPAAIGVVGT